MNGRRDAIRVDLQLIADMIEPGSRVLDVGCGEGVLLAHLASTKGVDGRGVELSMAGVNNCVRHGLSVVQGDADTDLKDYPSNAFDVVVLSQTLQATRQPRHVLEHLVRIGRRAIVSFPNFGHWRVRLQFVLGGRMPATETLPYSWYDTPNIHHLTIRDFVVTCGELGFAIERAIALDARGQPLAYAADGRRANIFAEQALFVLAKG